MEYGKTSEQKNVVEIRVCAKVGRILEIEEVVKKIREIEKEYNCHCTLLEITTY